MEHTFPWQLRQSGAPRVNRLIAIGLCIAAGVAGASDRWRTDNIQNADARDYIAVPAESFNFLSGAWVGEGLGGVAEYSISPVSAGTISLVFKHSLDNAPVFYEFIVIGEFDGRTALRLKHFNPDMSGWEERDKWMEFPLLELVPDKAAYFDGLTYRIDDDGSLNAFVIARNRDGVEREFSFRFTKRK